MEEQLAALSAGQLGVQNEDDDAVIEAAVGGRLRQTVGYAIGEPTASMGRS